MFVTWDNVMINLVQNIARVYADTPPKVIDFLSMAKGQIDEEPLTFELYSDLLFADEKKVIKLADMIDQIKTVEIAYQLNKIIDETRERKGADRQLSEDDIAPLLEQQSQEALSKNLDGNTFPMLE